jgi:quercetin dioxygenase-like cupin family protein
MVEKRYEFTRSDEKVIEKIVDTKFAMINHMILGTGDRLPIHNANSNVHMIVVHGEISLKLDEQDVNKYEAGSILEIPYGTKMDVYNEGTDTVELFVVKAPTPAFYNSLVKD